MNARENILQHIENIINSQRIAVLGTSRRNEPYSCLVAFAATKNLREIIFATMRKRLKYRNMMANPRVALMIDDRDRKESDFNETTSVTLVGSANEIGNDAREEYAELLLNRHPELTSFINSLDCAVILVKIDKIYAVSEFESVIKIEI